MVKLFEYNWIVRDQWFEWCNQVSIEELLRERVGGVGNILHTLLHIADVEYSWLRAIHGLSDFELNFDDYKTVEKVRNLSDSVHHEVKELIQKAIVTQNERINVSWNTETYTRGEILHHIIAHEIHHIGQLSVWARELGMQPVSANLIGKGLFE